MLLRVKNPADGDTPATPLNLTGYSVRMQARESLTSPTTLISLAPGSGITVNGPAGEITLEISDDTTAAWTWRYGVYGLEIESPAGKTTPLLKGEVEVNAEVAR